MNALALGVMEMGASSSQKQTCLMRATSGTNKFGQCCCCWSTHVLYAKLQSKLFLPHHDRRSNNVPSIRTSWQNAAQTTSQHCKEGPSLSLEGLDTKRCFQHKNRTACLKEALLQALAGLRHLQLHAFTGICRGAAYLSAGAGSTSSSSMFLPAPKHLCQTGTHIPLQQWAAPGTMPGCSAQPNQMLLGSPPTAQSAAISGCQLKCSLCNALACALQPCDWVVMMCYWERAEYAHVALKAYSLLRRLGLSRSEEISSAPTP